VYVFYRTENTVINVLLNEVLAPVPLYEWQTKVQSAIPLPQFVIYSLPEGLWILCITLTSKYIYVKFPQLDFNLKYVPVFYAIILEWLQYYSITKGQFDYWDILSAVIFWLLGLTLFNAYYTRQYLFPINNLHKYIFVLSYLIINLAHVM